MHNVWKLESVEDFFMLIAMKLYLMQSSMWWIIVFRQRYDDCTKLYTFFRAALKDHFTIPNDAPDLSKYRLVDMFTACTELSVKKTNTDAISCPESPLRIVVAITAFGMEIDFPDNCQIIHLGPAEDI